MHTAPTTTPPASTGGYTRADLDRFGPPEQPISALDRAIAAGHAAASDAVQMATKAQSAHIRANSAGRCPVCAVVWPCGPYQITESGIQRWTGVTAGNSR